MRSSGWLRAVLFGLLVSVARWTEGAEPTTKSSPPPRTISEVSGKNLVQWMHDLKDADSSMREEAIRAVVVFPGPHSGDLITTLLERCVDRDTSLRVRAIMALNVLDVRKEEIPRIARAMSTRLTEDPQVIVRFHAAVCLLRFGEDAREALTGLLKGAEDPSSFEIRRVCIRVLETCGRQTSGGPPDPRVTRVLLNGLRDPTGSVRLEAVVALGSLGKPADPMQAAQVVKNLENMLGDRDKIVVVWALVSLMALDKPTEPMIARLQSYLKSPDQRVRLQAIHALGLIGVRGKAIVPTLIELLDDKDPIIVGNALTTLAGLGEGAAPALKALTILADRKDVDPGVKATAEAMVKALKGIKDK